MPSGHAPPHRTPRRRFEAEKGTRGRRRGHRGRRPGRRGERGRRRCGRKSRRRSGRGIALIGKAKTGGAKGRKQKKNGRARGGHDTHDTELHGRVNDLGLFFTVPSVCSTLAGQERPREGCPFSRGGGVALGAFVVDALLSCFGAARRVGCSQAQALLRYR